MYKWKYAYTKKKKKKGEERAKGMLTNKMQK